jgi:glycosyltransferase involved in cell wall biosynthesis
MYVLVIAGGIPSNKYRGNGIFEFDQAKALAHAGCKVVYAALDVRSIRRWRKWGFERYDVDGVHVFCINIPVGRFPKHILHKISEWGLKILYARIHKEFGKPDILHAHFIDIGYAAAALKQKINVPLIITEHSSAIVQSKLNKKVFETAKKAYGNADVVVAVSPSLMKVIEDLFEIKSRYLPNIVDVKTFDYEPIKKTKDGVFRFISVGNLKFSKRMDLIIEAFHNVFSDTPNMTLTIFGEGKERCKIEKLIKQYDLEGKVKLMGMQPRSVIAEELKRSDCFVLPSRFETFGVVYAEALSTGLPVIATKCGGPECFVHEENGWLIPVDDKDALGYAMRCMYENKKMFDRKRISEEIKAKFSPESVAKELIKVFKEVIKP